MNVSIELNSEELSVDLMNKIKDLFRNKSIKITISEQIDTTEYLLKQDNNLKHLTKSILEKETVDFTPESFLEYSNSIMKD